MRAKLLKTRDSSGVGSYVDFKTDWATLSFNPWHTEDGGGVMNSYQNAHSNLPSQTGGNQREFKKLDNTVKKPKEEAPKASVKSDDESGEGSTANVVRGIKGKSKPHQTRIKLV